MLHLLGTVMTSTYAQRIVALVIALIVSSIGFRLKNRNYKGPQTWPLVGSAIEHIQNYHRFHDWISTYFQKQSTIAAPMPLGEIFYYTVDPANVKHILKTNFSNYPKGEVFHERMEILLGDGIFNTDGDMWRTQRKTAASEFSLKSLRDFSADSFKLHACKIGGLLSQLAADGRSQDMQDLLMRTTLDSIGSIGFGVTIGSLPNSLPLPENKFAIAFDRAHEVVTSRFVDPIWKLKRFFRIGLEAELSENIRVIDDFIYDVIAKRKSERASLSVSVANEPKKVDILSRFLDLSDSGHHPSMSDKILRDVVLNFVIAGRDTTAATLSWMLYMLAENKNICNRVYEELREFHRRKTVNSPELTWDQEWTNLQIQLGAEQAQSQRSELLFKSMQKRFREFTNLLTYDSMRELNYLQAVITETLRLYPAVPLDPKGILADDILPDGTRLKAGNLICYSPWGMARQKSIWGLDADVFNPDRWLKDGVFVPESDYKFTTFQAGLRTCLGKDSAYLQMKITAGLLFRFFELRRTSTEPITYRMMSILAMKGGIEMIPILRKE